MIGGANLSNLKLLLVLEIIWSGGMLSSSDMKEGVEQCWLYNVDEVRVRVYDLNT